jgi:hypothetical protein
MKENSSLVPTPNGYTIAMPHSCLTTETTVKMIHPQISFVGTFK